MVEGGGQDLCGMPGIRRFASEVIPRAVILGLDPRTHSEMFETTSECQNEEYSSGSSDRCRLHGMGPRVKPEDDDLVRRLG